MTPAFQVLDGELKRPKTARFRLTSKLLAWLIPAKCINCDSEIAENQAVCDSCILKLPVQTNCCARCGQAFIALTQVCGRCLVEPPPYDVCVSGFSYDSPIKEQIQRLKYADQPQIAKRLAGLLQQELIEREIERPDMLLPVPMHVARLRQRGYNQASLLCRYLANQLGIPYSLNAIQKHRPTAVQASLTLKQRKRNLGSCFRLTGEILPKHVAVVDDVLTTGATAAEVAKALKQGGIQHVQIWVVAHTL